LPIRAVLFDLDGVLVDTYEAWLGLVQATARHFGAPEVTRPAFDATWGQSVEDDTRELVPGPTVAEVTAHYNAHFREHVGAIVANPEARATLLGLRSRGLGTACVTNSPAPLAREILAVAGLREALDTVVAAGDVPQPKPAPDMVLAACRRLHAAPAEALLVGDSRFDEAAAAAAGTRYLHYDVRRKESLARAVDTASG
jgi:HAD superfamily hydrolase (TIGR01509 family)